MTNGRYVVLWLLAVLVSCHREEPVQEPVVEPEAVALLPLGDSITIGDPHTYRCELHKALAAASSPYDFVGSLNHNRAGCPGSWDMDHEGRAGWTTAQIDEKIGEWLRDYTPDVVLIHLGTNDAFQAVNKGTAEDDSEAALRSIVAKLRADNPAVTMYLAQILPLGNMDRDPTPYNAWIDVWNRQLAILAPALSTDESPVILVDMHSRFEAGDLSDGIHPTEDGAAKMATVWAEAMLAQ